MKVLIARKVTEAVSALSLAEQLRSRRAIMPGDSIRYEYAFDAKDGENAQLVQGRGRVELVRRQEPGILVAGHPRWIFRRECAIVSKGQG